MPQLPANLSRLDRLRDLDLSHVTLAGFLPASLASLTGLQLLSLSGSPGGGISGGLPPQWSSLTALRQLSLEGLKSGGVPAAWAGQHGLVRNLTLIDADWAVGSVQLADISAYVAAMAGNLSALALGGQCLAGSLEQLNVTGFAQLRSLRVVGVGPTVSGPIPAAWQNVRQGGGGLRGGRESGLPDGEQPYCACTPRVAR